MTTGSKNVITTEELPKGIIHDFQTFLDYVEQRKIKLTKSREYLTRKDLRDIYSLMEDRNPVAPEKGNQDDYPLIHLFFHLALTLHLTYKTGSKSSASLLTDSDRVATYKVLNVVEQYVTLLDTFWTKTDWEEIQKGRVGKVPSNIDFLLENLEEMPFAKNIQVDEADRLDDQLDSYENFLYYFGYFGLWKFEPKSMNSVNVDYARGTEPKSIKLMPRLKKLIPALVEAWNRQDHISDPLMGLIREFSGIFAGSEEAVEEAEEESESLFTLLQPLFAKDELKNILLVPGEGEPVNGNFTLNASLHSSCWRRLRLPGSATLLDLHEVIQEAFGFDDDHFTAFLWTGSGSVNTFIIHQWMYKVHMCMKSRLVA